MKPTARSLSTSSSMTFCLLGAKDHFFCLISLIFGLMLNRWVITSGGMPGMSVADQVKMSVFALRRFINCCHSGSDSCDLIWTIFSRSFSFNGMKTSCSTGSPSSWFSLWSNLSTDRKSSGLLFWVETKKQHRANCWSPRISPTLFLGSINGMLRPSLSMH